jgi:hypothetical protein
MGSGHSENLITIGSNFRVVTAGAYQNSDISTGKVTETGVYIGWDFGKLVGGELTSGPKLGAQGHVAGGLGFSIPQGFANGIADGMRTIGLALVRIGQGASNGRALGCKI